MEVTRYKKPKYIKELVKKLKKEETNAEKILWERLRNKQLHWYKFYRQKVVCVDREYSWKDRFIIADFYCHTKKLIIEVDWEIHNLESIKMYDAVKELLLNKLGYTILRFDNNDVINNLDKVIWTISNYLS